MKIKYIYQQFLSYISIIIIAFLIISLLFSHYIETLVYQNKVDELASYGKNILHDLERGGIETNRILNQYSSVLYGRNIQFSLFDENSEILSPIGRPVPAVILSQEEWSKITNGEIVAVKQDIERYDQEVTFVTLPYLIKGEFVGGILLTSPISGSRETIAQINQYLLFTVLIALVVSFLLSWFLSKFHVRRIKKMREATAKVAEGDYTVHIPSSKFDEIGDLANDFNDMVKKLNQSKAEIESIENRRRQFIADVSHEMRTPLTTISGVIEGLQNDMISEGEKEKGISLVSKETKRLIRLVNENLDYDKIRSNQVKLMKERIELAEVFEIIYEQLFDQAAAKNNKLEINIAEDVIVYADYDRLIQILINITKNSIQFTDNGIISMKGKLAKKETIIEIEDTGIGIDTAEIEKIWHRFYKADISRSNNPYGEFGLGLSIVKQLIQLHNGTIEVTSEQRKGTKFTVSIPFV